MKSSALSARAFARAPVRAAVAVLAILGASVALARDLPQVDRLGDAPPQPALSATAAAGSDGSMHLDSRLGVPTFLWAQRNRAVAGQAAAIAAAAPADLVGAARAYLRGLGHLYALPAQQADSMRAAYTQNLRNGGAIVKFRNRINGIEVFREEASVLLARDRSLVAIGGYLMGGDGSAPFASGPAEAAAAALADWSFGAGTAALLAPAGGRGAYQYFDLPAGTASADGSQLAEPVRVKEVLFRLPRKLVPAYYVEVQVTDGAEPFETDSYAYVVAADDLSVLYRHNQTSHVAFGYRVFAEAGGNNLPLTGPSGRNGFPHPTAQPDGYQGPFVAPNLVTLQNLPFSRNDPWLPDGATRTIGNNVDAFANLTAPDNFDPADPDECNVAIAPTGGDFRACANGANLFDYTYDTALAPKSSKTQVMAGVTNLFYMNNWLHDWFYDAGFDEASGNAQTDNFGRGGEDSDSIKAQAQDYAGTSNANMATPADGGRPRMRMYLFTGASAQVMKVNTPPAIAGVKPSGNASFGPQAFDLTGEVAYAAPADGCAALTNAAAVAGKIALIDLGTCNFTVKVKNAQDAGAIGVLIANTSNAIGNVNGVDATITIPSLVISSSSGTAIKGQLALPATVTARLGRAKAVDRDGALDNGVVTHEWGHYISNRLVANANGLTTNHSRGMGEGWSDFHAQLVLVKDGDQALPNNANFGGTYAVAGYDLGGPGFAPDVLNNAYYYGIRRYPYSRDMTKNPLTFKHIQDGVPLPASPPPAFGGDGADNSAVHRTGEVWASMLWECYSNLLNDTARLTFAQAQDRMKNYLVAGYKLTPAAPTFIEARDALLAAMVVEDLADFQACYQGFAKRGAGTGAVAPDRYTTTNIGVVESFVAGGQLDVAGITISDAPNYCDADGALDDGETGTLQFSVRNSGATALSATTATIGSSNALVTFPGGTALVFPPSIPGQTVTVSVPVQLAGAAGIATTDITLSVTDPGLVVAPVISSVTFRLNADEKANQSAADDVEALQTAWTTGSSTTNPGASLLWQRIAITATDHRWLGPDAAIPQLTWLQSPPLVVAANGDFGFTFRHRHSFEFDGGGAYDGGQIQISTDGGMTWADIGAAASPGYNGTMVGGISPNPLKGQAGYVRKNAAHPALETVTVALGTAYAGQTVRIRFAIGTDDSVGAAGWDIDDIAFSNITNTPFAVVTAHAGACYSVTAQAGSPQSATVGTPFGTALQALVRDGSGTPVPGVAVTFALPGAGASGTYGGATTVNTDASGVATAPALTANTVAGSYNATAGAGLQSASFALTNAPGAPVAMTVVSGTPQSATVATAFAPLKVRLQDTYGNVVPGVNVTFTAPASGASVSFGDAATVATDAAGEATSPALSANTIAGSFNVTAGAGALSAPFALTNLPGTPATVSVVSGHPQIAIVGTAFAQPLQVVVRDSFGNAVPGTNVAFAAPGAGATATFGGPATVATDGAGGATSPVLTANATPGAYSASATAGAAPAASFALTNIAPPVTTISGPTATGTGAAQAVLSGGGPFCGLDPAQSRFIALTGDPLSPTSRPPEWLGFPHGMFAFRTTPYCTPGGTITLQLTFPSLPPSAGFWKFGPTAGMPAHWYLFPSIMAGNTVTLTITDGQAGDDDLLPNGQIIDAAGPTINLPPMPVPALDAWMLALLAALLAFGASIGVRRARR